MNYEKLLINIYQKIADLTLEQGCKKCAVPLSCCSAEYCTITTSYARERWDVELEPVSDDITKPFLLGEKGCTAAPHLRPWCSLHACCLGVDGLAERQGWGGEYYFRLRNIINRLEDKVPQKGQRVNTIYSLR